MKKIILCIIAILMLTITSKVYALEEKINVTGVKIVDKSSTMNVEQPVLNNNQIQSSIKFNNINDYIIYEFTIDNKDKYDYKIDKVIDNNKNTNLSIEYDYKKDLLKSSKGTLKVKLTYKNKLSGSTNINLNNLQIKINLIRSDGKSKQVDINPDTGDNIIKYIVLFLISLIGILLLRHKYKTSKLLLVLPLFIIPLAVHALDKKEITIKFTNIVIKSIRETNPDGTPKCTDDEYLFESKINYVASDMDACKSYFMPMGLTEELATDLCDGKELEGYKLGDYISFGYFQYDDIKDFVKKVSDGSWCRPKSEQCFDISSNEDGSLTIDKYLCGAEYDRNTHTYNTEGKILDVVIPPKMTGKDGLSSVKTIKDRSFIEMKLTSVSIPNSVTTIGESAFSSNQLTTISIPNSVKTIGGHAFSSNQLTSLTLGNSIVTIGNSAFRENKLVNVSIPNSVKTIGEYAFYNNKLTNLTIGDGVTTISDYAFEENQLSNLTLGKSVTTIGNAAFSSNQLTSIVIPNTVTTIGSYAFSGNKITSLVIPNSVTKIDYSAFSENQISSLTLGNGIETIEEYVFDSNQLTNVVIPNGVTTIGKHAFSNNKITSLSISNSVITIDYGAFWKNQLTNVIIPDSVTTIGEYAFGDNNLNYVVIGTGVNTIGRRAFDEVAYVEDWENYYNNLSIIYNNTGKAFDWAEIITGYTHVTPFETGTYRGHKGNITITTGYPE